MIPDNDHFVFDMTWDQAIGVPNRRDFDKKSEEYLNITFQKDKHHLWNPLLLVNCQVRQLLRREKEKELAVIHKSNNPVFASILDFFKEYFCRSCWDG